MDEKLKTTINKIVLLSKQNPEFATELRKALGIGTSANSGLDKTVPQDIIAIRSALEIRGDKSINYDFIPENRLRDQLQIDNLRMENASLNLTEKESTRFYAFCINAFYQIENIINYYYYKAYPTIDTLLHEIESETANEGANGKSYGFHRKGKEETVADIPIADKINAFCNTFFPDDKIKLTLSSLRRVRNEGEHRCDAIIRERNEKESLYQFFRFNSFNSIRIILIKLVNEVKKQLTVNNTPQTTDCVIQVMLPSACFISLNGANVQIPPQLYKKVKNKKAGDTIQVSVKNGMVVDVL